MMMKRKNLPKILVILGPTATGKSDLAVYLAHKFKGEIISADSRQVYKGMNVGSGKITKDEMMGIPHHLLDVADPRRVVYSVERYKKDAAKAIEDVIKRKRLPIICGGTGFYIDALVYGEEFPSVPPNERLREKLAKRSAKALMKEISKLDPRRAKSLDPHNKIRIIRAIEIARALGKVPKIKMVKRYNPIFIGLALDGQNLRQNIHARLLRRMDKGRMVRETSMLHKNGLSWERLHAFGLEYRHMALYLRKKMGKKEMLERLEQEIVWYARRQMQWFKRNKNISWFAPKEKTRIAAKVRKCLNKKR